MAKEIVYEIKLKGFKKKLTPKDIENICSKLVNALDHLLFNFDEGDFECFDVVRKKPKEGSKNGKK